MRPSSFPRLALCPGSYAACVSLPSTESSFSRHGSDLHAALASDSTPSSPEDAALASAAREATAAILSTLPPTTQFFRETTLSARIAGITLSGTPDLLAITPEQLHIIDYKFGFDPVSPHENYQLYAYAALACRHFNLPTDTPTHLHIIQPTLRSLPLSATVDIPTTIAATEFIISSALDPAALRIPSHAACKYCPALNSCSAVLHCLPSNTSSVSLLSLTPERREQTLNNIALVEKLCAALKAEAKSMLEADPLSIPGWRLKPGSTRKSIDPAIAWPIASSLGIPPETMLTCCSVSAPKLISNLADLHQKTHGGSKKDAIAAVTAALSPATSTSQSSPTLSQIA